MSAISPRLLLENLYQISKLTSGYKLITQDNTITIDDKLFYFGRRGKSFDSEVVRKTFQEVSLFLIQNGLEYPFAAKVDGDPKNIGELFQKALIGLETLHATYKMTRPEILELRKTYAAKYEEWTQAVKEREEKDDVDQIYNAAVDGVRQLGGWLSGKLNGTFSV